MKSHKLMNTSNKDHQKTPTEDTLKFNSGVSLSLGIARSSTIVKNSYEESILAIQHVRM